MLRAIGVSVKRGWPIAKYGRSAAPFNVVPVDFVVSGLMAGSKDEKAIGETVPRVAREPISAGEVFTLLSELYANKKPSYTVPARPVALALRAKPVQKLFEG